MRGSWFIDAPRPGGVPWPIPRAQMRPSTRPEIDTLYRHPRGLAAGGDPSTMRLFSRITLALFTSLAVASASAAAQQPLPQDIVASSQPLSGNQESQVRAYADYWAGELADGDFQEMAQARDELVKSSRRAGVTVVFLQAYSSALMPHLTEMINGKESIRAENALRVAAFLRTPKAAGLVVAQADPSRNRDEMRRLVAAGLLPVAVEDVKESGLNSAELTTLARSISQALEKETNWHVVLQDLRAMGAIASSKTLTGVNRRVVRELQFQSFNELVNRAATSSTPSPLIQAVYRALLDLRMRLISDGTAANNNTRELASKLRISLKTIGNAAIKQWQGLSTDSEARTSYEGALRVGSQLLSLLEGTPDSRAAALAEAMPKGKAAFQTALSRFGN